MRENHFTSGVMKPLLTPSMINPLRMMWVASLGATIHPPTVAPAVVVKLAGSYESGSGPPNPAYPPTSATPSTTMYGPDSYVPPPRRICATALSAPRAESSASFKSENAVAQLSPSPPAGASSSTYRIPSARTSPANDTNTTTMKPTIRRIRNSPHVSEASTV